MQINHVKDCPCELRLRDLETGDVFELDCEEPKAVYLVVEHHPESIRDAGRFSGRALRNMGGPRYISLTFNHFMGKHYRRWGSNPRVRKLCAELNVARES